MVFLEDDMSLLLLLQEGRKEGREGRERERDPVQNELRIKIPKYMTKSETKNVGYQNP